MEHPDAVLFTSAGPGAVSERLCGCGHLLHRPGDCAHFFPPTTSPVLPVKCMCDRDSREYTMVDVVSAAQAWVEHISSHPNLWADETDTDIIEAVRAHVPGVRCQWTENPEYEGWVEAWRK
jgi:hypothetical protein